MCVDSASDSGGRCPLSATEELEHRFSRNSKSLKHPPRHVRSQQYVSINFSNCADSAPVPRKMCADSCDRASYFSATCASEALRFGRARMNGCMPCASSRRSSTDACMVCVQASGQQLCAQPDKPRPSRQVVARLGCAMQRLGRSCTLKIAGRPTGLFVTPLASTSWGIALHGGPMWSRHGPYERGLRENVHLSKHRVCDPKRADYTKLGNAIL